MKWKDNGRSEEVRLGKGRVGGLGGVGVEKWRSVGVGRVEGGSAKSGRVGGVEAGGVEQGDTRPRPLEPRGRIGRTWSGGVEECGSSTSGRGEWEEWRSGRSGSERSGARGTRDLALLEREVWA